MTLEKHKMKHGSCEKARRHLKQTGKTGSGIKGSKCTQCKLHAKGKDNLLKFGKTAKCTQCKMNYGVQDIVLSTLRSTNRILFGVQNAR